MIGQCGIIILVYQRQYLVPGQSFENYWSMCHHHFGVSETISCSWPVDFCSNWSKLGTIYSAKTGTSAKNVKRPHLCGLTQRTFLILDYRPAFFLNGKNTHHSENAKFYRYDVRELYIEHWSLSVVEWKRYFNSDLISRVGHLFFSKQCSVLSVLFRSL